MNCFLLIHTDIEGKYGMWLDYWRGGGAGVQRICWLLPLKLLEGGWPPLFLHICITVFLQVHEEGFSFKNSHKMDVYFWDYFKPENPSST